MPITNRYKPMGTTAEVDFKTTRACHATMKSHIDQVVLDNLDLGVERGVPAWSRAMRCSSTLATTTWG